MEGKAMSMLRRVVQEDRGMTTAEYAVGTLAAVAFAGVLLKVLTSATVQAALSALIQRALH
jgi:Flp pilus assembly pilin Flp